MTPQEEINEIYLSKVRYYYDFDLSKGIVEQDIIDKEGVNFTESLGLKAPCHIDDLLERSFDKNFLDMVDVSEDKCNLSQKFFLDEYSKGTKMIEKIFYSRTLDIYHRIDYYLLTDKETGTPHLYACCRDITNEERRRSEVFDDLRNEKLEIEEITASAQIGIWHIFMNEGKNPSMNATPKMCELLGIKPNSLTAEELYEFWYSRVKKSSLPSVLQSIQEMLDTGFSENTYTWNHPTKGDIIIRCGGTSHKEKDNTIILGGYHRDVTDIVNSEIKHKQLLEEALEEVQLQKRLLQEALDNYKEADYDRRRDFLTGLRNRQDMFELLQDVLSGKRENISGMFLMDIDDFKKLNDNYGHTYGDECLKQIGKALNNYSQKNDIYFYRYGGEEILAISFKIEKSAETIANEIVQLISLLNIKREDTKTGFVTVSLGYTTDNHRYEKMIDMADIAMYKAKQLGKNQAVCYEKIKER